jgi:transposase
MPGKEISLELRSVIIALSKTGSFSHHGIANIVRRNRSTISKIITRYKTHGTLSSAPRIGRPPKISARDKRRLLYVGIRNRFSTATQVLDQADLSGTITPSRANQLFKMEGLSAHRPRKKPFLSQIHRKRRLAWALLLRDWDVEQWRQHIFTDELTIETGKPDGSILVRRRPGEAYNEDCLRSTFKSGRSTSTSNHWGAIHHTSQSELVCL